MRIIKFVLAMLTLTSPSLFAGEGLLKEPTEGQLLESIDEESLDEAIDSHHGIVVGTDNRVRYSSNEMPWRTIGKIRFGMNAGWYCTGTLIGPRHVLTNAHCIDTMYPVYFYPSYNNGDYLNKTPIQTYGTWIYWGTATASTSTGTHEMGVGFDRTNDWAIVVLDKRVGDQFGWLGVQKWNNTWLSKAMWTNAGFPDAGTLNEWGKYPLKHELCTVKANLSGFLSHDCDTGSGSSGAPIFANFSGQFIISGLNNWHWGTGTQCPNYSQYVCANGAVTVDRFYNTVNTARSSFP